MSKVRKGASAVVGMAVALSAGAAASVAPATILADGLHAYEGELLELGHPDPNGQDAFKVLDIAFIEDGRATLRATLDAPVCLDFAVHGGDGEASARGIVEPGGEHRLRVAADGRLTFSGGRYHALVGASGGSPAGERLRDVYLHHEDPVARVLALREGWLDRTGAWRDTEDAEQLAALRELTAALGEEDANVALINAVLDARDAATARAIKDFHAASLGGDEVRLADVLRENKYTLVEFWASWCGPCIAEIPHLKTAYERFRDKGFEILAVNLDEDAEAWRKASVDDYAVRWLNVSDNQAFGSPVAKMYRVRGIPANFLVSADGKTVARHLRGEAVVDTLAELLDD